jgi:hypothetical protein
MAAIDKEVHALHRYLIWSIHMRDQCLQLKNIGKIPDDPTEKRLWLIRPFMWLALWLALLYVVAEGYKDLGLSDPVIDEMLGSQNLDLLRRFRNGAFHFQRDYFDARFTDVWSSDEVQDWAVRLHNELRRFFLEWYKSKGLEIEIIEEPDV